MFSVKISCVYYWVRYGGLIGVTIISYRLLMVTPLRKRPLGRTTKDENRVSSVYLMEIHSVPFLICPSKRKALWVE